MIARVATSADARAIAANVADGFASWSGWAPAGWTAPVPGEAEIAGLQERLSHADVWCLLALEGRDLIGHVSLSPVSTEDPQPAPPGVINLWQLFVCASWRGRGVAGELIAAAVVEAARRGYRSMRLWTPRGAARARRFYEREGWTPTGREHERSPSGLATVEYRREV